MEKHYYPLKKNKNIFVGQQLSTIIQQFLFVHRLHRLNRFLLVNNYQQLFNNFYLFTDYTDNTDFCWSKITNNYSKIFICPQI